MNTKLASLFLRAGLFSTFFYAAIASFNDPAAWIGFFPALLRENVSVNVLLFGFSGYELLLCIGLMTTRFTPYAAFLAGATVLGIILFNIGALDLIFRDVAIFFAAAALFVLTYDKFSSESA